ncbi:MAG: glycoside hydrolase family 127 protein [Clostridia bacterium]|nr:glycoside hydrolase family 127 protein [Clostridia bacterium]
MNKIPFANVEITGGFWKSVQDRNRDVTLECVRSQFEKTGRFAALRCDWREGMENKPHIFWDSDVAKWAESAAYVLKKHPDAELERRVEDMIDRIEQNQRPDGYYNSCYLSLEPGDRFTNRWNHELYCAGHWTEAAIAYYEATGKRRFLDIICRYIDLIDRVFRVERSASFLTPGHEEIELALMKLYACTGEEKYRDLGLFFLDMRGTENGRDQETASPAGMYMQAHLPVREQRTAEGHCVRACYLYSAMADAARLTGDGKLREACEALFDNICEKRMYITGGIGSSSDGERFTGDYDLPNADAYAETCAAISLAMFASRMSLLSAEGKYADIVERTLYNGILSGVSLDGTSFFYTNPLAIDLDTRRANECREHVYRPLTHRVEVFGCSCCPPNVTRFLASLGDLVCGCSDDTVFVHQYMQSTVCIGEGCLRIETNYPDDGTVRVTAAGLSGRKLALRIPAWCLDYRLDGGDAVLQNGYLYTDIPSDDFTCTLTLSMKPTFYEASPRVAADAGKVALMKGPVVYCLEGIDNDDDLHGLCADLFEPVAEDTNEELHVPMLTVKGWRKHACACCGGPLYRPASGDYRPARLRFIPYYAFANRAETDMTVWVTKF